VPVELFAGVAVSSISHSGDWYTQLLGVPSFQPNETELVWSLAEGRHLCAEREPEHAGHSMVTVFVDDLEEFVGAAALRGVHPSTRETYENGVRKAVYRDPDGNTVSVGGAPA